MNLRQIIGHKEITSTLRRAIEQKRVAHAYLFAGPAGVGKATTARAFAAALLCRQPRDGDACGQCRDCRQMEEANHPDLHRVIPHGSSIKIGQVREMLRNIMLSPYQGRRKVYLLEKSDLMTAEAVNCLLKTLEEPPADTVLILTSARPQALLPTVLSRCQVFSFHPLPVDLVVQILEKERSLTREEAQLPALLAGGCPGRALELADEGEYLAGRERVLELAAGLGRSSINQTCGQAAVWAEDKEKVLFCLELLQLWYRDLLIWQETAAKELLVNQDRLSLVRQEAGLYNRTRLVAAIKEIERTRDSLSTNINTRLALEMLFMRLAGVA